MKELDTQEFTRNQDEIVGHRKLGTMKMVLSDKAVVFDHKGVNGLGVKNDKQTFDITMINVTCVDIGFTSKSSDIDEVKKEYESQIDFWEASLIRSGKTLNDFINTFTPVTLPVCDEPDSTNISPENALADLEASFSNVKLWAHDDVSVWVRRHLELCDLVSSWSKDPSSKFGCFITDTNNRPLGYGFNGFPRNFNDTPARWLDRDFKYAHVIHAEENAILNSNGSLMGAIAYVNGCPCSSCMGKLAQVGVSVVWAREPTPTYLKRWSLVNPATVAKECGISLNFVKQL